ncbi:DUF3800 domain-containing protein [Caenimonas koreensis DSM 17982]|uniref:DUF3800 domain-containing protein n=1 Tax=Caenimonas koreensis DSM 17982 TaxID=1121255 RepID=A0A844B664_9BURK|nr:DUF3800 domain-containing protein [Caenimonas koreensis]MRD48672.1 DUF3800 domain-containing protein [Caenimonas koreensis DSM 17982]
MATTYNIYCDESCHLEHDGQSAMVLGAVWCPQEKAGEISERVRDIVAKHGMDRHFEVKWTKVSESKELLYLDLVDYFFDDDDLHFRALVVPDKSALDHGAFPGQDHDTWYYKMYFDMLKALLSPRDRYRIYIDIKDTKGAAKVRKLHEVLSNNIYDFSREVIERVQLVRSHESSLLQLADLMMGAVSYVNRGLLEGEEGNVGKRHVVERVRKRSRYTLDRSTLLKEGKFNIFRWQAQGAGQ